jgi:CMP-N-acetylneuraminic acid synthetase
MTDNILITICARGGSKGVKGKNIRNLNGHPLIYYTIKQALEWGKAKHVIVTTDSKEIAQIAKDCGAEVPFLRPKKLATDTAPTLPVLKHALLECEKIYGEKFDILIDLPVTAPVRTIKDFENAYKIFKKRILKIW